VQRDSDLCTPHVDHRPDVGLSERRRGAAPADSSSAVLPSAWTSLNHGATTAGHTGLKGRPVAGESGVTVRQGPPGGLLAAVF
jgi:hypothetical protein